MKHNGGFGHNDWHDTLRGEGRGDGLQPEHEAPLSKVLADLGLQTGIWASACLLIATAAPPVLVAPFLQQLLLLAGFTISMVALLRGETLSLARFNRQDVALALVALALIAGLFVDHAAVQHFVQQSQAAAPAGAAETAAGTGQAGAG